MKGKQITVLTVSWAHLVPHALKMVDSVSSDINMQIHVMIQCDICETLPTFISWGTGYESVYYGIWDTTPT